MGVGPSGAPIPTSHRAIVLSEPVYSLILQEKEEQILQLKEEVADLKTLVRVLEDDNARIKRASAPPDLDFDLGLEA